jgi:phosphoglycolate phosphatase
MTIELICFDMAGTTVNDQGLVMAAFRQTIRGLTLSGDEALRAETYVMATMGQSKIDVFTHLFGDRASTANDAFERHFIEAAVAEGVSEVLGTRKTVETLKERGIGVALTTGFSPSTREALIEALEWHDLFPVRVSPADAGRGRPAPDMLWLCGLRAGASAAQSIMVVGDTASDMQAGRRAAVGQCVGVLSGNDDAARLTQSGADYVIGSVADLDRLDVFVAS